MNGNKIGLLPKNNIALRIKPIINLDLNLLTSFFFALFSLTRSESSEDTVTGTRPVLVTAAYMSAALIFEESYFIFAVCDAKSMVI